MRFDWKNIDRFGIGRKFPSQNIFHILADSKTTFFHSGIVDSIFVLQNDALYLIKNYGSDGKFTYITFFAKFNCEPNQPQIIPLLSIENPSKHYFTYRTLTIRDIDMIFFLENPHGSFKYIGIWTTLNNCENWSNWSNLVIHHRKWSKFEENSNDLLLIFILMILVKSFNELIRVDLNFGKMSKMFISIVRITNDDILFIIFGDME